MVQVAVLSPGGHLSWLYPSPSPVQTILRFYPDPSLVVRSHHKPVPSPRPVLHHSVGLGPDET